MKQIIYDTGNLEHHTMGEESNPRPTSPSVFHRPMGECIPPPPKPPLSPYGTNQPPQTTKNPPSPSYTTLVDGHPPTELEIPDQHPPNHTPTKDVRDDTPTPTTHSITQPPDYPNMDGHPSTEKEDDIFEEDDIGGHTRVVKKHPVPDSTKKKDIHPDTDMMIQQHQEPDKVLMDGHHPPPIPARLVESPLSIDVTGDGDRSAVSSTTRADTISTQAMHSGEKKDDVFGKKNHQYIMVKGVVLSNKQMKRKDDLKKTTPVMKVKKTATVKKNITTTPSRNKISNYFVRKRNEDSDWGKMTPLKTTASDKETKSMLPTISTMKTTPNKEEDVVRKLRSKFENEAKKTFINLEDDRNDRNCVKKKIENFKMMSTNNEKCLIGSGRCASHNTRVVRVVKEKRVSGVNKDGTVGWKMCEVTTLACPAVNPGSTCVTRSNDGLSDERGGAMTNKRARIILEVDDQSELRPKSDERK